MLSTKQYSNAFIKRREKDYVSTGGKSEVVLKLCKGLLGLPSDCYLLGSELLLDTKTLLSIFSFLSHKLLFETKRSLSTSNLVRSGFLLDKRVQLTKSNLVQLKLVFFVWDILSNSTFLGADLMFDT